jgi:hypothetical protein
VRRGLAAALALGGVTAFGTLLAACGDSGVSLAREACGHVDHSFRLYDAAQKATDPAQKASLLTRANTQLETAEPIAAQATSANGQWNALMTTLQEIGRVDEGHLVHALRQQCQVAFSNQPELPPVPTTFPPAPPSPVKVSGSKGTSSTTSTQSTGSTSSTGSTQSTGSAASPGPGSTSSAP